MSSLKLKVSRPKPPKSSNMADISPASARKRRLVLSEDEDEMDTDVPEPEFQGNVVPMDEAPSQAPTEMDVDVEAVDEPMEEAPTQPRSPTPDSIVIAAPTKRVSKKKETTPSGDRGPRKRLKKKSAAVYSDEDGDKDDDFELEDEMRVKMEDKDADDDFVPASQPPPPKKSAGRKPAGAGTGKRGRPKRGASKGADLVITMKDERKITTSSSATPVTEAVIIPPVALTGTKKRKDTLDGVEQASSADSAGEPQKTVIEAPASPEDVKLSPSKKKLPPIKKNKSLVPTAPSSGPSTPGGPSMLAAKAIVNSTVRKPIPATGHTVTTADINLSDSNVYNSLFKPSGYGTRYVGVSIQDGKRRELKKRREQAQKDRLASLQKTTFDLSAGQEKVSKFENAMRNRNSPALYPAHLGTVFKFLMQERQKAPL